MSDDTSSGVRRYHRPRSHISQRRARRLYRLGIASFGLMAGSIVLFVLAVSRV